MNRHVNREVIRRVCRENRPDAPTQGEEMVFGNALMVTCGLILALAAYAEVCKAL